MQQKVSSSQRCVLLFSGGFDSALAAFYLSQAGYSVSALTIDYPSRPALERKTAVTLSKELPFIDLSIISIDTLHRSLNLKQPSLSTASSGRIFFRNLLFWSIAFHHAAAIGARVVAAGHTVRDAINYPDAGKDFFSLLSQLSGFSGQPDNHTTFQLLNPLQILSEEEKMALINANYKILISTWSCWHDLAEPCGSCYACLERETFIKTIRPYATSF